jgi:O-antigen biosynthesis protein WbqP
MGNFLRRTSIDELPQLINILKGEMSFVGPRPVINQEGDLIREREKYGANDVRPGLTGWAQIHGRDDLGSVEKAKLDGFYVANRSFAMDMKILFITFVKVFKKEGIMEVSNIPEEGGKP